jgi:DNA ligase-4
MVAAIGQQPSVGQREDRCNGILFVDLCNRLERIEKTSGTNAKLSLIFNKDLAEIVKGESLYPLVRLLLPLYDTERGRYGLKQATVAKVYIEALQLNKNAPDAKRLIHWKDQSKVMAATAASSCATVLAGGDFFAILEDVLRPRVREAPSNLTLENINRLLDILAGAYGEAGRASFIKEHVLNEMCPLEQKWLMRIIFQDLKVGLKLESILNELSPWAAQCYNESSNLRMVCEGGAEKKRPKGISPFSAFSPMLAKGFPRTDQIAEAQRAMKGNPFVMDLKLDGERMLCHVDKGRVMLLTRNGNDYTSKYASIASDMKQRMLNFESYILDGEVCAYDTAAKKYIPFGSNKTVAKMENSNEAAGAEGGATSKLVFIVFDIVYASGKDVGHIISNHLTAFQRMLPAGATFSICDIPPSGGELTQLPFGVRRAILSSCLIVQTERIMIVQNKTVLSTSVDARKSALERYFSGIVDEGEEGLVVKDLLSTYELGEKSRSKNASWIKMKPEYSDECTDMDMIILGAYFGEGKSVRGKGVSHFLLGVIDDRSPSDSLKFASVCKVGTGYTFSELTTLREKLDSHWRPWNSSTYPSFFSPWKIAKSDDVPHVWIEPQNSVIVEINCAELIPSSSFAANMTCRFPRVRRIRYDKEVESTMKFSELQEISRSKSRGYRRNF